MIVTLDDGSKILSVYESYCAVDEMTLEVKNIYTFNESSVHLKNDGTLTLVVGDQHTTWTPKRVEQLRDLLT